MKEVVVIAIPLFAVGSPASLGPVRRREHASLPLLSFPSPVPKVKKDLFAVAGKTKASGHVIKWSFILARSMRTSAAKQSPSCQFDYCYFQRRRQTMKDSFVQKKKKNPLRYGRGEEESVTETNIDPLFVKLPTNHWDRKSHCQKEELAFFLNE